MITVIASIEIKPESVIEFIQIFRENVPKVLEEDGCIEYYPTVDMQTDISAQVTDPSIVTIIEAWDSIEALKRHLASPHMDIYREKVKDLVVGVSLKILQSV